VGDVTPIPAQLRSNGADRNVGVKNLKLSEGVIWMYDMDGSGNRMNDVRRTLGRIWADVTYGQQRVAELNRPWLRSRRRSTTKG